MPAKREKLALLMPELVKRLGVAWRLDYAASGQEGTSIDEPGE